MPYYPPSPENSAETTVFLAGGDIQAQTVQAALAELSAEKARAGENTDITSLGTLEQPLKIKGELLLENVPRFKIYATVNQTFIADSYNKVLFSAVASNTLCQVSDTAFICRSRGIWSIKTCLYLIGTNPNGHAYLEFFVNGVPYSLLATASLSLSGAHILSGILDIELNVNDYVETFVYSIGQNTVIVESNFPQRCYLSGRRVA